MLQTRAVEPEPKPGAGAQAILDGWSRSHTFFRWWSQSRSRSLKFGFRFKRVTQIIQCFFCFLDQIVLERELKISRCWSRSQKIRCLEPEIWVSVHERRKRGFGPWILKISAKIVVFIALGGKKQTLSLFPPPGKYLKKSPSAPSWKNPSDAHLPVYKKVVQQKAVSSTVIALNNFI